MSDKDTVYRQAAIDALEKEKPTPFVNKDGSIDPFGAGRQNQWYRDGIAIMNLPSAQPDCSDCIKHGGDWDCDHVHCHIGKSAQPDNDMIHLQKEQAYLQGWEEGREALRKEIWENGRDRLD